MNFYDNKEVFGFIFFFKNIEVGFYFLFCGIWFWMVCYDICSIWICFYCLFFILGYDLYNWYNLCGIRMNFVICYEYRYYISVKYKC